MAWKFFQHNVAPGKTSTLSSSLCQRRLQYGRGGHRHLRQSTHTVLPTNRCFRYSLNCLKNYDLDLISNIKFPQSARHFRPTFQFAVSAISSSSSSSSSVQAPPGRLRNAISAILGRRQSLILRVSLPTFGVKISIRRGGNHRPCFKGCIYNPLTSLSISTKLLSLPTFDSGCSGIL